jgi:amino acid adenylation domain-containing protein/non-ribosomal peptide synthase protein (TIGR01720 family)
LQDLAQASEQLRQVAEVNLGPKTSSFQRWSERLLEYARSEPSRRERSRWLSSDLTHSSRLPIDHENGLNTVSTSRTVHLTLDEAETRELLEKVPRTYHTQINDALLTALADCLAGWTGSSCTVVDLEGHGREPLFDELDISRTVGWFTTVFPFALQVDANIGIGDRLKRVKEQLRAVPRHGLGYGLLRYLSGDAELQATLSSQPKPLVSFNYLGQVDQSRGNGLFGPAREATGPLHADSALRRHVLEINGSVIGGQLKLAWTYSEALHRGDTIERVAENYRQALRSLIAHCRSIDAGGYTPSDFPLAMLDQRTLDRVIAGRREVDDLYPLSPAQQGMLFHSQLAPESFVYFEQLSCMLAGELNVAAFVTAWQRVIDRHAVLRSSIQHEGVRTPLHLIERHVELQCHELDWTTLREEEQETRFQEYARADRARGFDLSHAPLMRLALVRCSTASYRMLWSHHHLLMDGWSVPLVLREVIELYAALRQGRDIDLGHPKSYRDYIAWLQRQDLTEAEAFWRSELKDFNAPTPLVIDSTHRTHVEVDAESAFERATLSKKLTAQLEALVQSHQLTMSTLVQGAWSLLLSRYSGHDDVVFGITVSGRPPELPGVESIVGLFINTLPLRVVVDETVSTIAWLKQLQARQAAVQQFAYSPLVEIHGWSDVPRGRPLFESILVFENYPIGDRTSDPTSDLRISKGRSFEKTNYPLTVTAAPGAQLFLEIAFESARFEPDSIRRMLGHFERLLAAIVDDPTSTIGKLAMLTNAEQQRLVNWGTPTPGCLDAYCIHELFEQQVLRTPDSVALVFSAEQLTYAELNSRANQVAHRLTAMGVGPEMLVGICVERSLDLLAAILGTLKAGAAYLQLDPVYGKSRLAFMLESSRMAALITQLSLVNDLPEHTAAVFCIDRQSEQTARFSDQNPVTRVTQSNLAYVIYTSGSTGHPKGVMVTHANLVGACRAWEAAYGLREVATSHLQMASISFDVFAGDWIRALCFGAKLVLCPRETLVAPEKLYELMVRERVDCAEFVPIVLRALARYVWQTGKPLDFMRVLVTGSDCWYAKDHHELFDLCGRGTRVINSYGLTETTIDSCYFDGVLTAAAPPSSSERLAAPVDDRQRITGSPRVAHGQVPIGRPYANNRVYILDANLRLVPIGVPGTLYIGGDSVTRGYCHQPDLTADRFLPDPFSASVGARLYRTGDLARYLPDGQIELLGRADRQLKVRGFRIEPAEVEAALAEHPLVHQSVVLGREDYPGEVSLVACISFVGGQTEKTRQLREFLSERLPEYMVPTRFVPIDAVPITPNGKVDYQAIAAACDNHRHAPKHTVAPRNPLESKIERVWAEVLGRQQIGIDENFFELGGHSLRATQVVSRLRDVLGIDIPLRHLFAAPTIAEFAEVIATSSVQKPTIPAIAPVARELTRVRRSAQGELIRGDT